MTDQPLPEGTGLAVLVEKLLKERDLANKQLAALRWQVEHEGCAASHLGETTYECRADAPCGLCRLRAERDRLRAEADTMRDRIAVLREALEDVREWARQDDVLAFEDGDIPLADFCDRVLKGEK